MLSVTAKAIFAKNVLVLLQEVIAVLGLIGVMEIAVIIALLFLLWAVIAVIKKTSSPLNNPSSKNIDNLRDMREPGTINNIAEEKGKVSLSLGKTCPYCQFPIKVDAKVTVCTRCMIPHHEECWQQNGKCTTYGCRGR